MANKHLKRLLPSLIIWQKQIKTTVKIHILPIVLEKILKFQQFLHFMGKQEFSHINGGNECWYSHNEGQFGHTSES